MTARIAMRALVAVLVLVVLLGIAAIATLQTPGGRRFLAAEASKLISTPEAPVTIGEIGFALPNRVTLDDLRVGDASGEWLRADHVVTRLDFARLVSGRIGLKSLEIGEVVVARLPASGGSSSKNSGGMPSVAIDHLAIARLRLAEAVLGESVAFDIDGKLELGVRDIVALTLQRTDGVPGRLALDLELDAGQGHLVADGQLDEPTGVLLERLTGRRAPLSVHLSGQGPLAAWHGALKAESGAQTLLAANFAVTQQGTAYAIDTDGSLAGADFVPSPYADLVRNGLRFNGRAIAGEGSRILLDRLDVTSDVAQLAAHGSYDTSSQALDAELDATVPDLAKFTPVLGTPLAGSANLRMLASGTASSPVTQLLLTLDDAAYRDDRIRHLEAALDLAVKDDRIDASGSGRIAGIAVGGAAVPAGFGEAADWRIGGSVARDLSRIRLDGAEVAEDGASFALAGTFANGAADGTAWLTIDDLARLSAATGRTMTGSAVVDAVLASSADGATSAHLTGHAEQLVTGQAALDALTGGRLDLAATVRRGADGTVTLDTLELSAADGRLSASGELSSGFDRITAKAGAELPDLGPLAAAMGSKAAGRLSATAELSGPLASPQVKAGIEGGDLVANGVVLGRVQADFGTPDLSSGAGKLKARLAAPDGFVGTLASGVAWRDGTLALAKLQIEAAGARIAGDLDVTPATPAARGAVTLAIPDLAAFSRFAGTKLAGRIDGRIALSAKEGQTVDLTLNGQNLALGAPGSSRLALAKLTANGKLTDVLGAPKGQAEARLTGIAAGGGTVEHADLRLASIAAGRFRIAADAAGRFIEPVTVSLGGDALLGGPKTAVTIAKLAGKFGPDAFALTRPLQLERDGGATSFSNLALTIGPGRIAGNGRLDGQSIAVTLRGEQLPLGLGARLAGYREVAGRIGIDLDLQGSPPSPRGRLIVTGDGLRFAAAARPDLPPLTLSARGDWQSGRVDFRGRIDAPRNAAIGFYGSAPFELRQGFAIAVPRNERLAVKLEGDGELAQFNDLLPFSEDRISGRYALNASVDGTIAAPKAGGSLVVRNGHFEEVTSGLTLTGIDFELAGNEQRFVMRRFAASDGDKGRITAMGGVDLVATPGPAIDLQVALQHLHAVRRDDADVTASGTVNLGGTFAEPQVAAEIAVENGELRVPDRLPPSAPNLSVVRVNSKTGATAPAQAKPTETPPKLPVKLAIKITAPGQVFVRGRGLDAEWRGDLDITGTSAAPVITGSLRVVRGTFSLLGKDFNLTRGTISFTGGTSIDPVLDLVAEASSTGITVQAIITGPVSSPSVRLTSTPVLPQDEVLARLLFGTSVGQITPIQGLQLAQAAAQLAGGGGTDVLGTIRRNLGLDRLAIGSGGGTSGALPGGPLSSSAGSSRSGLSDTTLQAGKYVIPGFYVGVVQGIGSTQSAVRVEGEVTPNVTIDAQVGGQARESIGLNFKLDY
jgi:translocation and assembly module TamB